MNSEDNVRSIVDQIVRRNAEATIDVALTDEFCTFLLDQADDRFDTDEEKRAFIIGGACTLGFYGREIKTGIQSSES